MLLQEIFFGPIFARPLVAFLLTFILVYIFGRMAFRLRHRYMQHIFLAKKNRWVLLEIRVPNQIRRSPEAMELFLTNAIYWTRGDGGNKYLTYWQGQTRLPFSLEIVSRGGSIHFYIYTPSHLKDLVQSQLYIQYPQVEVKEASDYTEELPPILSQDTGKAMYAGEFESTKIDAYPIKTYRMWNLDKAIESLEEDQQIDPLTTLLEKMAAIDPWEEMWLQYVVRVQKDNTWRSEGEKEIDKIISGHRRIIKGEKDSTPLLGTLTKSEQDSINAIETNIDQKAFEVGIRAIFITHRGNMFKVQRIGFLNSLFAPFNTESFNKIESRTGTGYNNPWQDYNSFLENKQKERSLERYRARWFFPEQVMTYTLVDAFMEIIGDYKTKTMILTGEELATLFHIPGGFYQSQSLDRIEIRKPSPPSNLPT